jgi:hypothetical protein
LGYVEHAGAADRQHSFDYLGLLGFDQQHAPLTLPAGSDPNFGVARPNPSKSGQNSPQDRGNFQEKNTVTNSGGTAGEGGQAPFPYFHVLNLLFTSSFILTRIPPAQVPFPYFHVLNLLSTITFILIAFGFLTIHVYFSPVFYFVTVLIFCALRDISAALADPFGSDEVRFVVSSFLIAVFRGGMGASSRSRA